MIFCKNICGVLILYLTHCIWCCQSILVVPEDVPAGLLTFYGFSPPFLFGTDSRLGFGFRLGNHADFQILYEFGPQTDTRPLRVRSISRNRYSRRPFIRLLIKAGLLRDRPQPRMMVEDDNDEPR